MSTYHDNYMYIYLFIYNIYFVINIYLYIIKRGEPFRFVYRCYNTSVQNNKRKCLCIDV